jgi:hypothetical protein
MKTFLVAKKSFKKVSWIMVRHATKGFTALVTFGVGSGGRERELIKYLAQLLHNYFWRWKRWLRLAPLARCPLHSHAGAWEREEKFSVLN